MTQPPVFPPLLTGVAAQTGEDPFQKAQAMAALGCDGGTLVHDVTAGALRAAIVFAPEVPLADAMTMLPVCGVGFQNALGALAPPEVAVHLSWDGQIRVNGARCGQLVVVAADTDPAQVPDWLVVGLSVPFRFAAGTMPGETPDTTALIEEGCAELEPIQLLESWARHALVWINRWQDEGPEVVHAEWLGLVPEVGKVVDIRGHRGTFLGVDDRFGVLLRDDTTTHLVPLTELLQEAT